MPYVTDPVTGQQVWNGDSIPAGSQTSIRQLIAALTERVNELEAATPQIRVVYGTLAAGDSSMTFTFLEGEVVYGVPAILTSGGGVLIESVTQSGTTVTVSFTGESNVELSLVIQAGVIPS